MSLTTTTQIKLPPQAEAILYFFGLMLVYLASYAPPIAAPDTVRTVFTTIGLLAIIVKYELSQTAKPQITSHQVLFSTIALILSVVGGQISAAYASVWEGGLIVAIIGAVLAAYEDLGGKIPTVPTTTP